MVVAESVDLTWTSVDLLADAVLAERLGSVLGPGPTRIGRLCPRCASSEHGRPWARHRDRDVAVSLARAGAHQVAVVAPQHDAVNVDVEEVAGLERHPLDEVLAAGESVGSAYELARAWVAKEAILKALGTGLSTPMRELRIADYAGELRHLDAPQGFVAALALGGQVGQHEIVQPRGE